MDAYFGEVAIVRVLLQRGIAAIYLVAFLSAWRQGTGLLGSNGLLPIPAFVARVPFRASPSLFHLHYSDRFFGGVAATGAVLAALALLGLPERGPLWLSIAVWLVMWVLYLSIV